MRKRIAAARLTPTPTTKASSGTSAWELHAIMYSVISVFVPET